MKKHLHEKLRDKRKMWEIQLKMSIVSFTVTFLTHPRERRAGGNWYTRLQITYRITLFMSTGLPYQQQTTSHATLSLLHNYY